MHAINAKRPSRSGFALLICMFMIVLTSTIVIGLFRSQSSQMTALRSTLEYERCRYLAEAGIQDVVSRLQADRDWTGTTGKVVFPRGSDGAYTATAVSAGSETVSITSVGVVGEATSTMQITYTLPPEAP